MSFFQGGSAHVVVLLTTQCPQDLTPFAGKLMSALLSGLTDRNTTIQQSYATALAHLVKVAHDSSTEKLLKKLTDWYLDKEDATLHHACALTTHSISQHCPDALHRHGAIALPLAFLGMNEATVGEMQPGSNPALWSAVWDDNVPGNAGGVRLYLDELLALSQKALQSRSWNLKAQGATAIAATVKLQGANLRPAQLGVILGFLLQGLPGRIWTGKEQLLKAISSAVTAASDSVKDLVQPSLPELLDALKAECRRENLQYRMAALTCFSEVLQVTGQDRFSELAELLFPLISQSKLAREVIREEKDEEQEKPLRGQLEICVIQCLGKSWPKSPSTQEEFAETFYHLLCQRLALCPWKEQVAILQALHTFVDRLCWLERDHVDTTKVSALLKELAPALSLSLGNKSYSSVRTEALVVLELLLSKLKGLELSEAFATQCESLRSSLAAMDSDRVPELRDRAHNLLIHLNDLDSNYMS
uniref:proteasome adapter and scaffold protein ECM29-like n=1 Tax=Myxine glutinosa TaxID=7769 RepID=UPI00358F619D